MKYASNLLFALGLGILAVPSCSAGNFDAGNFGADSIGGNAGNGGIGKKRAMNERSKKTAPEDEKALTIFRKTILDAHNSERLAVGSVPVYWNTRLEADARKHAQHMARTGRFEHAADLDKQGENLWSGTRGMYSPEEMISYWAGEYKNFKAGTFPDNSTTGSWTDVQHYSQLIWWKTTQIGCAIASSGSSDYLVCRYAPKGNIIGQNPLRRGQKPKS